MTIRSPLIAGALAASLFTTPAAWADEKPTPGRISVSATATAAGAPDLAILNLSVRREGKTAREALDANNDAMAAVLEALKKRGIEDRDLQTANFNISPRYVYPRPKNGQQEKPELVGYTVSNVLTVRVRDLLSVGAVIDESVTLGVNEGGNISFSVDNPDALLQQARKSAMEKAIAKAKTLVEAAGADLGRILSIAENNRGRPRPQKLAARSMELAEAAAVPVAAGESAYEVTVSVTWEIAQ